MESINLDKYKEAWKKEPIFEKKRLTEKDISQFIRSSSKSIRSQFRSSLILDITLKSILLMVVFYLLFFMGGVTISFALLSFLAILSIGIFIQAGILRKLSHFKSGDSVVENLQSSLAFYYTHFRKSIWVSATTATLVFLIGSYFYLQKKYGKIPTFEWDDYVVYGIGILLSFGISFYTQNYHNQFKISQLEDFLNEAGEVSIEEKHIQDYHYKRKKWLWIFVLMAVLGIVFFMYLLFI